jgi:cobalt/nickel transport system permease protein
MSELAAADSRAEGETPVDGAVQRVDPRVRIALGFVFALVAVTLQSLPLLALTLAMAAVLAVMARLPAGQTLRRMLGLDAFMVPILLFLPFTVPGPAIAWVGPFAVTTEGIHQAIQIVLTANTVVLAVLALVGTIEPAVLGHALLGLGVPEKMTRMLLLTVRYIAVLRAEHDRLRLAMRARAFHPTGNTHTWKSYGFLFGMLLVRSFERSERILQAMKCRGFAGRYFVVDAKPPRPADWLFAGAVVAALLVLAACRVAGRTVG